MEIHLAVIRPRSWPAADPLRQTLDQYLARCSKTLPTSLDEFRSEAAFWTWLEKRRGRVPAVLILADSCGRQLDSASFARELAALRDRGAQQLVLGIGPADGWTSASQSRADLLLSFGKLTLPHELAAVIAAEQIYRATAIWSGHPYHGGH